MEFEKRYVLFQFCASFENNDFEEVHAIRFKFANSEYTSGQIYQEIKKYGEVYCEEMTNKAWRAIRPNLFELTPDEIYDTLKKFYMNCNFCFELITKEEYKSWKEEGKSGKIVFN